MSKILANQIANYGDNSPVEVKEGVNIPAGKPLQADGVSGASGQVLSSTGTSIQWIDNFSGSYTDLINRPTIPAAQVKSDWNAIGTIAEILNKPIVPPQPSVTVNTPGFANLVYNSINGEFTYTPPDLSSYATSVDLSTAVANSSNWDTAYSWGDHATSGYAYSTDIANATNWDTAYSWGDHSSAGYLTSYTETDPVFDASPAGGITSTQVTNWDTAYTWGDHSAQGYLTGLDIEDLGNVDITGGLSDQQILKWDASTSSWKPANDLVGGQSAIELADLSVSVAPDGSPNLTYNNTNGVFTYTPPDLSPYLTIETDPVFSAHVSSGILQTNINNWNSAYSWGDHASAGYATTTQLNSAVANSTNWDSAYSWGDHSTEGYLTTETDPVFGASPAGSITSTQVTNWDSAYNWGDHSTQGYLTNISGFSIGNLSDVNLLNPIAGQVLKYDGANWIAQSDNSGNIIANVTISDTAPGSPSSGDLWWESDKGRLKVYYNDTDSLQWVDASPPLQQDRIATSSAPSTATSPGSAGEIRYDANYVYICVATNTWKRAALTTW